jgi:hypothetical protein
MNGALALPSRGSLRLRPSPTWPEGAEVLDQIRETYLRYVFMRLEEAVALALFVSHTYVFDAGDQTPYMCITAPTMRAGKTLVLDVSEAMVYRPMSVSAISPAALYRVVDAFRPTLLLDEQDAGTMGDRLRRLMNSGYRQSGKVIVVERGVPCTFRTFCPKVLAGIGALPATVLDRSIVVRLKRALPEEAGSLTFFDAQRHALETHSIRSRLASFGQNYLGHVAQAKPRLAGLRSRRAEEIWRPLWSIADLAGGQWPDVARDAAIALQCEEVEEDLGVQLLADCRTSFGLKTKISTSELLAGLCTTANPRFDGDINPRVVAAVLRRFDIGPHNIRFGTEVLKGYVRRDFEEAWRRYVR